MERTQSSVMSSLQTLREDLTTYQGSDAVRLSQAFDRLMMGYLNGTYDETSIQAGIAEIRSAMKAAAAPVSALRPAGISPRDEVLNRNYSALAQRMLDQSRGSWDSRHVEIVQGAISHLAQSGQKEAGELALSLQKRMSDSVWLGNIELADSVAQIQEESHAIEQSLIETLNQREHQFEPQTQEIDETERILASVEEVRSAVQDASARTAQARNDANPETPAFSKEFVESLNRKAALNHQLLAQSKEIRQAQENIRQASRQLMAQESQKLEQIYKSTLSSIASQLSPEDAQKLSAIASTILTGTDSDTTQRAESMQNALKSLSIQTPQVDRAIRELDNIQWRAGVLTQISAEHAESEDDAAQAQQLDARMLFEQKRMQFEQSHDYPTDESEMLKALDYELPVPAFETSDRATQRRKLHEDMMRVHQVAQSAHAGDAGFYAPRAGSEYARNTESALRLADDSTPSVSAIPTIQSEKAKRSNRLLSSLRQLAFHPSVRADMGFPMSHAKIDEASQKPLFKRVRFNQNDKETNALLPSLYRVAGIKLNKTDSMPLRKSYKDLNLHAANLELIKIIENQFDPSVSGRRLDRVSGIETDSSQRVAPEANAKTRVADIISDWLESRKDTRRMAADTQSLIQTGRMKEGAIESSLKSESMKLPASVQEKLSPFLGFDISKVKVYSGPVAAMAAEAMGAHAFTLGSNIFLGKNKLNYETPEGLGLLAHELLHTSHFGAGDSIDSKEQAAEAMEDRVKRAFGSGGSPLLALERDTDKKSSGQPNLHSTKNIPAGTVGARPAYDPDQVFDAVCEKVTEMLFESLRMERERNGED